KNNDVLQNHIENQGYFRGQVTGEVSIKNRRAKAIYTAVPGPQYKINKVVFESDSSVLQQAINRATRRSLLKKGQPFDLDIIKQERTRIDNRLKQRGFYFFNEDHLIID